METFDVRDLRQKDQYITDDKFLNGYARFVGIYAVGVYGSLCRHANKAQSSWPSIKKICEELSIGRNSAITAIKYLEYWRIVERKRIGKMANNRYFLLHKRNWKPINEITIKGFSEVCDINFSSLLDKLQRFATQTSNSKETHSKELNIKEGYFYDKQRNLMVKLDVRDKFSATDKLFRKSLKQIPK